ncbi:hypothetical protein ACFZC5_33745 [Nocardia gamkensis]|uniref:hypothetical protein n=1 Tax=Nocardia gamkensis TaxID=352869 RepID=UPI0036ED820C
MPDPPSRPANAVTGSPGPGPGRTTRVEHECFRHGALALLAALDVHTGQVFADYSKTTGIKQFMDLVGTVLARPRYRDAPRVFVIVDNGPDHRGATRAVGHTDWQYATAKRQAPAREGADPGAPAFTKRVSRSRSRGSRPKWSQGRSFAARSAS